MKTLTDSERQSFGILGTDIATTLCHCWVLELKRSIPPETPTQGFTSFDEAITIQHNGTPIVCKPDTGYIPSDTEKTTDLNVDTSEVMGVLNDLDEYKLAAGLYDDAKITMYKVDWSKPANKVTLLKGVIGEVTRGRNIFTAEIRGLAHAFQQPLGRTYGPLCDAKFGDTRCGFRAPFTQGLFVSAIHNQRIRFSTNNSITENYPTAPSGAPTPEGYYNRGVLGWTAGRNIQLSSEIKRHTIDRIGGMITHTFELWEPTPFDITLLTDSFAVQAGCDKTFKMCKQRRNIVNFRGFPHLPGTLLAFRVADKSRNITYDGGALVVNDDEY